MCGSQRRVLRDALHMRQTCLVRFLNPQAKHLISCCSRSLPPSAEMVKQSLQDEPADSLPRHKLQHVSGSDIAATSALQQQPNASAAAATVAAAAARIGAAIAALSSTCSDLLSGDPGNKRLGCS